MKHFRAPKESLANLDPESIGSLISSSSDIALVLDQNGTIYDLAFGSEEWSSEWYGKWLGQSLIETVTVESRPKIESLLADARARAEPRWRQVNHPSSWGADVPVTYTAMQIGADGPIVACGRELWSTSLLQQRLIDAQHSMERHYAKLRHIEARYRLLFQMTTEAVLVLDSGTWSIVEANPAAEKLLDSDIASLRGMIFTDQVEDDSRTDVISFFNSVRASGRADEVRAKLRAGRKTITLAGSLFRQESTTLILLRLMTPLGAPQTPSPPSTAVSLLEFVEGSPDAIVVTNGSSNIIVCNPSFLDLVQLASKTQAMGQPLERWLGRPGVDLNVLRVNLRQHGAVRLYPTTMRNDFGSSVNVEVSAVSVQHASETHHGFIIRNVDQRPRGEGPTLGQELPHSVHQLTELVGRVPLKELVRETVDVIERMCIEAALELTGDNRASAAELLGLSRQSLYVKLRRYGLADTSADDGTTA